MPSAPVNAGYVGLTISAVVSSLFTFAVVKAGKPDGEASGSTVPVHEKLTRAADAGAVHRVLLKVKSSLEH
jgi:hypothetical protein